MILAPREIYFFVESESYALHLNLPDRQDFPASLCADNFLWAGKKKIVCSQTANLQCW